MDMNRPEGICIRLALDDRRQSDVMNALVIVDVTAFVAMAGHVRENNVVEIPENIQNVLVVP